MVKHVILWTLKDQYSGAQMEEIKAGIKEGLEGLSGKIPGLGYQGIHQWSVKL